MRRTLVLSIVSLLWSLPAFAGVPSDFDGDSQSDRVQVEVGSDKTLTWKAVLSATDETKTLGIIGKEGDHLIMAQWLAGGTQIGVVSLKAGSDDIVWSILNDNGERLERTFGKKGDLVVSGADFNGNGTADAAVVRLTQGKADWQIRYDMFTSESVNETTVVFGKAGDRAFYASLDGTVDSLGMIRRGKGNRSMAQMRNLVTGQVRKFLRLPKFASVGARPRAFPVPQSSGEDLIGFHVQKGQGTEIRIYSFGGTEVENAPFEGKGESVVGQFSSGEAYEVLFEGESESGMLTPARGEVVEMANLSGIPVDEVNVNTLGAPTNSNPSNGGGGSGGGNSGGGSISQCSQNVGWPGSHIYKTIGSTHFTDIRRNTVGVILRTDARGPFPDCVEALDSSGRVIAKLGLYARGAGWAARYYAGIGCGSGTPFNGSRLGAIARTNTGSSRVYMKFGEVCYGPIEATQCIGSQQC
jgi:hypothetical protein